MFNTSEHAYNFSGEKFSIGDRVKTYCGEGDIVEIRPYHFGKGAMIDVRLAHCTMTVPNNQLTRCQAR